MGQDIMIYPVIGSNYVLNLQEYFPQSNQFQTNSSYYIQQPATVINDTNVTNFPAGSTVVDTTSNLNLETAVLGGQIAALVWWNENYYVYVSQVEIDNKTPIIWIQLSQPILGYYSSCYTLVMLSNQNIIVSCVSMETQIFYYFDQLSEYNMMPYLYETGVYVNVQYDRYQLQSFNISENQWQIFVTQEFITIYNVSALDPKVSHSPINISYFSQFSLPQTPIGSYIISPYSAIIYFPNSYTLLNFQTNTSQQISIPFQESSSSMGAFTLGYSQDSFEVIVTLQIQQYLYSFYIISYQSTLIDIFRSETVVWGDYQTNYYNPPTLLVGPEFVVVLNPYQKNVYAYPGWLNSNKTQNLVWSYNNPNQNPCVFNPFTQDIYVFGQDFQSLVHLGTPFMLINLPENSTTESQIIQVTANDDQVNTINFLITPVLPANYESVYSTSEPSVQHQQLLNFFQWNTDIISNQFIGANLTYQGTANPQQGQQTNVFQSLEASLNVSEGEVLFSQILPYDLLYTSRQVNTKYGYLYVLQLITSNTILQIYFCNELVCGESSTLKVNSTVLGVATSNNQQSGLNQSLLAIYYANSTESVQVYTFQEQQLKIDTWKNIIVNSVVPTTTVSSIQIVSDMLYIVTATPQSLQVVPLNNLTNIQVYEGVDFTPRQIYSSPLYPNLIFIDNTYELRIYRVLNQFMSLSSYYIQTFPYQLQMGSTVGVGILYDGIYIAESNETNSALTLYPTPALDSFLNISLSNLTIIIPLSTYKIRISNPVISTHSLSNFYLSITASDKTNQLAVFQYTGAQLNVLYFSKYLPTAPSQISLASVIFGQEQSYDVLCYQQTGKVTFLQITNNTYGQFIPQSLANQDQNYTVIYTATTPGFESLSTSYNVMVIVQWQCMAPVALYHNNSDQTFSYIGGIQLNPASYFTGYVKNYTAELQFETQSTAQTELNQLQIIQPIQISNILLPNGVSATSSYANAYNINSTMFVNQYHNIPYQQTYQPLYQMNITLFTSCPFIFMYNPDLLVIVCTNDVDSYLVYNNNSTITNFTTLLGNALPNLISAQYNYSQSMLALENNLTNTTTIFQITVIQLTYDGQNLKQFGTALIQNHLNSQATSYGLFATLNSYNNVFSFGVAVITNNRVVQLFAIEQNETTYNLTVTKNYTVIFPPNLKQLSFIAIQMYSIGTYNRNTKKASMLFVLQTKQEGYIYEFITQPNLNGYKQVAQLQATRLYTLNEIDIAEAVTMLVQNSSIVTIYAKNNNNIQKILVGVFTLPDQDQAEWLQDLYFISYMEFEQQNVQCPPENIQLSSNSTLFFTACYNQYSLQIQPRLTLTFNLSNLNYYKALMKESINPQLFLIAHNSQQQTSTQISGQFVLPEIYGDHSIPSNSKFRYYIGVFFFFYILFTLIYLCAKTQSQLDNYEQIEQKEQQEQYIEM